MDNEKLENPIAENIEPIVMSVAKYTHIMAPATTFGKNIFPRIAVKLDIAQVSDVIKIISSDTFMRPIYAGNAIATVKSNDKIKIITVRPTSFEPVETSGGSGMIENLSFDSQNNNVEFIEREEQSERPELMQARVVISGV